MPSGHTDRSTISRKPLTPAMAATLRRLPLAYRDMSQAERNHVRALNARGLADYDLQGQATRTAAGDAYQPDGESPAGSGGNS